MTFSSPMKLTPSIHDVQFPDISVTGNGHVYVTFRQFERQGQESERVMIVEVDRLRRNVRAAGADHAVHRERRTGRERLPKRSRQPQSPAGRSRFDEERAPKAGRARHATAATSATTARPASRSSGATRRFARRLSAVTLRCARRGSARLGARVGVHRLRRDEAGYRGRDRLDLPHDRRRGPAARPQRSSSATTERTGGIRPRR